MLLPGIKVGRNFKQKVAVRNARLRIKHMSSSLLSIESLFLAVLLIELRVIENATVSDFFKKSARKPSVFKMPPETVLHGTW
jgi:hypothetical protein